MQDTKNLNRKVGECSRKIRDLQNRRAPLTEINYWRRELTMVNERIASRYENRMKNAKQYRKAN